MMPTIKSPSKEIDVNFLVFVQRYATDLLKWDILTFLAHHPDCCTTTAYIAKNLGRSAHSIQPDIGDLALLGILEQTQSSDGQDLYRLTREPNLRQKILKFAT
jgi:hypothetical protein